MDDKHALDQALVEEDEPDFSQDAGDIEIEIDIQASNDHAT